MNSRTPAPPECDASTHVKRAPNTERRECHVHFLRYRLTSNFLVEQRAYSNLARVILEFRAGTLKAGTVYALDAASNRDWKSRKLNDDGNKMYRRRFLRLPRSTNLGRLLQRLGYRSRSSSCAVDTGCSPMHCLPCSVPPRKKRSLQTRPHQPKRWCLPR